MVGPGFRDDHAQLVDDVLFAEVRDDRADESAGRDLGRVSGEEFGDSRDAVADDVLEQAAREPPHPVLAVGQNRPRVPRLLQVVAVDALHVNRLTAQVAGLNDAAQPAGRMAELFVMATGDLERLRFAAATSYAGLDALEA